MPEGWSALPLLRLGRLELGPGLRSLQIFRHPVSHNIEWRAVLSLLEAVGTVTVRHDGKVAVAIGPEREFLDQPPGKDIDAQMVADLRRMLSSAGYRPS